MTLQELLNQCAKYPFEELKEYAGIYLINYSLGGKVYIGSTNNFKIRWRSHLAALRRKDHHSPHLLNIVNKHGVESLEFYILELTEQKDEDFLIERENFYLLQVERSLLINDMIPARKGAPGWKGTEKQKAFISQLGKISKYRVNRVVSEETRKKLSDNAKNQDLSYLRSPEIRAKAIEKTKGPRPHDQGELSKKCKYGIELCRKIKEEYDLVKSQSKNKVERGLTRKLSEKYGVSHGTTVSICSGNHWSNISYIRPRYKISISD